MAFCIRANEEELKFKYCDRKTPFFSNKTEDERHITIFSGEFHSTEKFFSSSNWIDNLENIEDSFSVITIDKKLKEIIFATSKYGLEPLYYYSKRNNFIISDDFWEIANITCSSECDIDRKSILETMNGCYPLFDGTYLKNVKIVDPAIIGKFNFHDGLTLDKYFELKYTVDDKLSEKDVAMMLDKSIERAIEKIRNENGDVKYAFGLSGGLDSRLISCYTQNMNIQSFIIGDARPHKLFLARDHSNARRIADIYRTKHTECRWDKEVFLYTKELDLKNNPMGTPQFFKGQTDVDFDVLINGGNGYIVGSTIPNNIETLSITELATALKILGREFFPNTQRNLHLEKVLRILLKKDIEIQSHKKWFDKIYHKNTENEMLKKFEHYVLVEKQKGKTNFDIYEGYFHNVLGARNKYGGFESLSGNVRSFSIYNPHVFDESLHWPFESLNKRKAVKYLIKNKMPEASYIGEQKYEGSIRNEKSSSLNRFLNVTSFVIRGNGSEMVNTKFRHVRNMFINEMKKDSSWFYNIFPIKDDIDIISKFDNKYALLKIWKIKNVLDLLETREFRKYISNQKYKNIF